MVDREYFHTDIVIVGLGVEPKASCMLGRCFNTEAGDSAQWYLPGKGEVMILILGTKNK